MSFDGRTTVHVLVADAPETCKEGGRREKEEGREGGEKEEEEEGRGKGEGEGEGGRRREEEQQVSNFLYDVKFNGEVSVCMHIQ